MLLISSQGSKQYNYTVCIYIYSATLFTLALTSTPVLIKQCILKYVESSLLEIATCFLVLNMPSTRDMLYLSSSVKLKNYNVTPTTVHNTISYNECLINKIHLYF